MQSTNHESHLDPLLELRRWLKQTVNFYDTGKIQQKDLSVYPELAVFLVYLSFFFFFFGGGGGCGGGGRELSGVGGAIIYNRAIVYKRQNLNSVG